MKTALDLFIEKLEEEELIFNHGLVERWKQQAKEIEQKQIKDAWLSAWKDSMLNPLTNEHYQDLADEYYNKTFKT